MKTIETTLTTTAVFSDDEIKRYSLTKVWDSTKARLGIVMLVPNSASGIELDNTTMLVLNNASRLGYGSVSIVNLFATIGDYRLTHSEDEDAENINAIAEMAKAVDTIVYAAGVGKATNKSFIKRQTQVLMALRPYEEKLKCITNRLGTARYQHPLSPVVREWTISDMSVTELIGEETVKEGKVKERKNKQKAK